MLSSVFVKLIFGALACFTHKTPKLNSSLAAFRLDYLTYHNGLMITINNIAYKLQLEYSCLKSRIISLTFLWYIKMLEETFIHTYVSTKRNMLAQQQ